MAKWKLLISQNTILNFGYIKKLFCRYKFVNIAIALLVTITCWRTYFDQKSIYVREVGFVSVESSEVKSNPMLEKIHGTTLKISINDLTGMLESRDFLSVFAHEIVKHTDFKNMIFIADSKVSVRGWDIHNKCTGDISCTTNELMQIIKNNFKIFKNAKVPGFTLRVHSYEDKTAVIIEKELITAIKKYRQDSANKIISTQLQNLESVIINKQKSIGSSDITTLNENLKIIESKVSDIEKSIIEVQLIRNREKAKLFDTELKLKHLSKDENTVYGNTDREKMERAKTLETKIMKLLENKEILQSAGPQNESIIRNISDAINHHKAELKSLGHIKKGVSSFESFQKNKNEVIPKLVVERNVFEGNVLKLDGEIEMLSGTREDLQKNRNELREKIESINPEVELLQVVKKQYSTLLMSSSMRISDLQFDNTKPESEIMKVNSFKKILCFNILISIMLTSLWTFLRFTFNKNLYSIEEFKVSFPGLEILGGTAKIKI